MMPRLEGHSGNFHRFAGKHTSVSNVLCADHGHFRKRCAYTKHSVGNGRLCAWCQRTVFCQTSDVISHLEVVSYENCQVLLLHLLSPGGFDVVGKDDVPLFSPQYAAKTACAEDTSAVCDAQEYRTEELITWLTLREF